MLQQDPQINQWINSSLSRGSQTEAERRLLFFDNLLKAEVKKKIQLEAAWSKLEKKQKQ